MQTLLQIHRVTLTIFVYEGEEAVRPACITEFPLQMSSVPPHDPDALPLASPLEVSTMASPRMTDAAEAFIWRRRRRGEGPGPEPNNTVLSATLPRSCVRTLALNVRELARPLRYSFAVCTRSMSGASVLLARSADLCLESAAERVTGAFGGIYLPADAENCGGFEYTTLQFRDGGRELETLRWLISEQAFLCSALPRIFSFPQVQVRVVLDPLAYLDVD